MQETGIRIAAATPADEADWRRLFAAYCAFYGVSPGEGTVAEVWRRIVTPGDSTKALVARDGQGRALGICNYVLHAYTWGTSAICYLEDLFTVPEARGQGVGRALIGTLVGMGREQGWDRVYWHTAEDNATARTLYDKVAGGRDGFVRYVIRL
ncbi:GNAT family N-acetyltransferase [Aerophototrophica crusticola]|uniref:GNAT family N-acetyltransferase n=1 Tax=Aerophototrophica crusticola TaxID=1709002 RepID=A0A858R9N2_9PROT|nr:GNAT family N-acetyltransferase [Rhodospirillaceae bacterium B3]